MSISTGGPYCYPVQPLTVRHCKKCGGTGKVKVERFPECDKPRKKKVECDACGGTGHIITGGYSYPYYYPTVTYTTT